MERKNARFGHGPKTLVILPGLSDGLTTVDGKAILSFDAYSVLSHIQCPTLVISGGQDRIVGPEAARTLAGQIQGSELFIYESLGHAAYEEAPDFNDRVFEFLDRQ